MCRRTNQYCCYLKNNQKTNKKYVVNDVYDGPLYVNGSLTTSNLTVLGTSTSLETVTYITERIEIVNDGPGPGIFVQQNGVNDVARFYQNNDIAMAINENGNVGIKTTSPFYELDVIGTIRAHNYIGVGSNLIGVNLGDKTTSQLVEGSNLYYTQQRVDDAFDARLAIKTADNLADGTSNRYIVNDVYDSSLTIEGTTTSSNLDVYGLGFRV